MYLRTIASSRRIGEKALAHLARRVKGEGDGVVVFNPVGWKRNGMIEVDVPQSKRGTPLFATAGDGKVAALQPVAGKPGRAVFYAEDVPSYGWRRYRIDQDLPPDPGARIDAEGTVLENNRYKVTLDTTAGLVTSVFDKWAEFEGIAPGGTGNRLEVHWEEPNGMSAWTIGKIAKVEPVTGTVETTVTESGPARVTVKWTRRFGKTDLVQTVSLPAKGAPEFSLDTQWNELGSGDSPNPFLKVAFDVNATSPTQTYEIPFGTIERPGDGTEYPALKWADSADTSGGASILNDSKHGHSAEGNTLRLSLIRSSYYPDPRPNDRPQSTRWSYLPHTGDWKDAGTLNKAAEFNKPLWSVAAGTVEHGTLPAHGSFLGSQAESVVITGVKQAEDDDDLIVRFYEAWGEPAQASFQTLFPVTESRSVNFIEDEIALEKGLSSSLGKAEIKTLKLTVGKGALRH